jgi:hypothetical protein
MFSTAICEAEIEFSNVATTACLTVGDRIIYLGNASHMLSSCGNTVENITKRENGQKPPNGISRGAISFSKPEILPAWRNVTARPPYVTLRNENIPKLRR